MGALRIIVTGAGGFVGRACVAEARRRGLPVVAVYRSAPAPEWQADDGITPLRADLSGGADALAPFLVSETAIIHAAAHLGDDPDAHIRDTLNATRNLLHQRHGSAARLVLISSIAVYDTDRLSPMDSLTEDTPLLPLTDPRQTDPKAPLSRFRDTYASAKRLQEALLCDEAGDDWILRPGAVWGTGRSWHPLQGFQAAGLHVTIGSDGELPLCHVQHLAWAAVEVAQTPTDGVGILNVFDDDRPTRARFLRAHRRCFGWPRLNITVPYGLWLGLARLLKPVSGRLPGLFREPVLRARMMPLRYPNTRLRHTLRGEDFDTFEGMMARVKDTE